MIRLLTAVAVIFLFAACSRSVDTRPFYTGFDETLTREMAPFPVDRPLVIGTNLWIPGGYEKNFNRALTLVNIGEERLIPFNRIDAYIAVNIPDGDNPIPYDQPRENPGRMLLKYGQTPLKADEKYRWVDLRMRFETETQRAMSLSLNRLVAVDESRGLELAFRPWISLPETAIDIAGVHLSGHQLIRLGRPGIDIIIKADTLSLRYTRPNPVFRIARLFTRAYPVLLGSLRDMPISGMATWMDQRRGFFKCPAPSGSVQYCDYEEFHAQ